MESGGTDTPPRRIKLKYLWFLSTVRILVVQPHNTIDLKKQQQKQNKTGIDSSESSIHLHTQGQGGNI